MPNTRSIRARKWPWPMLQEIQKILDQSAGLRAQTKELLDERGENALGPEARRDLENLKTRLKAFHSEMSSPQELCNQVPVWKDLFGEEAALLAAQILYAFHRERRAVK